VGRGKATIRGGKAAMTKGKHHAGARVKMVKALEGDDYHTPSWGGKGKQTVTKRQLGRLGAGQEFMP